MLLPVNEPKKPITERIRKSSFPNKLTIITSEKILYFRYFELLIHEDSDVALIRIFECFLEVAPQKILQITIILGEGTMNG